MKTENPSRRVFAAVFLVCLVTILLELTWMRLFVLNLWNHFAFLVIAISMVGFGAAGATPYYFRRIREWRTESILAWSAMLFGVSTLLALTILPQIRVDMFAPLRGSHEFRIMVFSLALCIVLQFFSFFFAGLFVVTAVSRYAKHVSRIYAADLTGASCGVLAAMGGIWLLGAPVLAAVVAVFTAGISLLVAPRRGPCLAAFVGVAALAAAAHFSGVLRPAPAKQLHEWSRKLGKNVEFSDWTALGRVDVLEEITQPPLLGGHLSTVYVETVRDQIPNKPIFYDNVQMSPIYRSGGSLEKLDFIPYTMNAFVYQVAPERSKVLVLGVGGGIDVLAAQYYGASQIIGVELNSITSGLLNGLYRDYTGGLFSPDRCTLINAEGRSYTSRLLRSDAGLREEDRFDLIQMSVVDTYGALSSGAYATAENYLYTKEAFRDYLRLLKEDGILCFLRRVFDPPREALRIVTLLDEVAGDEFGLDPSERTFVADLHSLDNTGIIIFRKTPLSRSETDRLVARANQLEFKPLYYPRSRLDNPFSRYLTADDRGDFYRDYYYNVRPTTDDKPFFFQFYQWKNLLTRKRPESDPVSALPYAFTVLFISAVTILILSLLFIVEPLLRQKLPARTGRLPLLLYFACLGVGYMLVEITSMQRFTLFMGDPIRGIATVLFFLLLFSGLGSLASKRVSLRNPAWVPVPAALAVLFLTVGVPPLFRAFLGASFTLRVLIAGTVLAPVGFLMGLPFPSGIRLVDQGAKPLVPIAWGANACASTFGSTVSALLAISLGYRAVTGLAGLIYLVAAASLWCLSRSLEGAEATAVDPDSTRGTLSAGAR